MCFGLPFRRSFQSAILLVCKFILAINSVNKIPKHYHLYPILNKRVRLIRKVLILVISVNKIIIIKPMFVKEAYEQRLKKEEQDLNKLLSSKKARQPKIGSIKNDKINYDKQEQFFSKDDIPLYARTIKEEINNLIDPDHLGLRKKNWNASVSVPKNFEKEETHEQKLLKIKLGFTDHPIPKYKEPFIYQGTETRNDFTKWNVSNQILPKQIKENHLKRTQNAFQNTKIKQDKYLKDYTNPLSKTTVFIEAGKQKVQSEAQMRKRLRENYIFDNPTASQEKINAAVHRLAYETTIKQQKDEIAALAMKTDFKPALSMTQKSRIHVEFSHSGIWQKFPSANPTEEEQWGWSCCMNEDKDSKGCNVAVKDGNRWNLSSFNNR